MHRIHTRAAIRFVSVSGRQDRPVVHRRSVTHGSFLAVTVLMTLMTAGSARAATRVYTADFDFDKGTRLNVSYDASSGQLQIDRAPAPFPYLWVAASGAGTIVRIDVDTGKVLGEYSSAPLNWYADPIFGPLSPSRTTVDRFGSVWAANRDLPGSVVKIGLLVSGKRVHKDRSDPRVYISNPSYTTCVDRDGDGLIRTSLGLGDVLPWPKDPAVHSDENGSPCGTPADPDARVQDAEDECILVFQKVSEAAPPRQMSLDMENNIWVAEFQNHHFRKVDGATGCILAGLNATAGGYGGLIDCNGVLWSTPGASFVDAPMLRYDTTTSTETIVPILAAYGMAIDSRGFIWVTQPLANLAQKVDPISLVAAAFSVDPAGLCKRPSGAFPTGAAVTQKDDNVWTANRWCNFDADGDGIGDGYDSISRLDSSGNLVAMVPLLDPKTGALGGAPTGVAVDGNGKVWVTNQDTDNVMRIDPATNRVDLTVPLRAGSGPYNYSDMVGGILLANPPYGSWTFVSDLHCQGDWHKVSWNQEQAMPPGSDHVPAETSLTVEVRAADSVAGLTRQDFTAVANGIAAGPFHGCFLETRVSFAVAEGSCGAYLSPILTDLSLDGTCSASSSDEDEDGDEDADEGGD